MSTSLASNEDVHLVRLGSSSKVHRSSQEQRGARKFREGLEVVQSTTSGPRFLLHLQDLV